MVAIVKPVRRVDESSEAAIQFAIRERLKLFRDLLLFRNAQAHAEVWDPRNANVRHAHGGLGTGSADLVGILRMGPASAAPLGRWFCLEVKKPGGRVSPEQRAWLELVRQFGGFAAIVYSPDQAVEALERARRGACA